MAEEVVYAKVHFSGPEPTRGTKTKIPKLAGHHFWNSPYRFGFLLLICIVLLIVSIWLIIKDVTRNSEEPRPELNRSLETQQNLIQMLEDANQRVNCLRRAILESDYTSKCPPGWMLVSQKCYFLSTDKKMRKDSVRFCVENGGVLATVRSKDSILKCLMQSREFWVGLEKKVTWTGDVLETQWFWFDNTRELSLPSTPSTQCVKMEDIPVLSPCTDLLPWICERKPDKSNLLDKANAC